MRCRWARSTPRRRWWTRCARAHPDLPLLVTTITPTGSARVRALWGDAVEHVYLPYDLPGAVARFLAHFRPRAGAGDGNRVVAEPAVRLPRPRRPDLHPQRAAVGAFAARLSRARAAGRRARCARCARVGAQSQADARALRAARRAPATGASTPATSSTTSPVPDGLAGFRRATFRDACGDAPGVDRGQHPRGRRSGGHRDPSAPARALARTCCCCGRRAIPSASARRCDHAHAAGWRVADAPADALARRATTRCSWSTRSAN